MMSRKKRVGLGQWILTAVMGLYTIVCLLPVLLVVVVSFTSDESVASKGFSFFPESWSLAAWEYVLSFGKQLYVSYGVTIYVTIVGTAMSLIIMGMFAYTLSRKCFMIRKYLSIMLLITMLFSGGQLSVYLVSTTLYHLSDKLWALILPGVSAMHIIILRTYIQSNVHDSLIESAKMDGAKEFRIFWQIVFPMMKPVLASVGFMRAVELWNDWTKALLFIQSSKKTPLQLLLVRIEEDIQFLVENADATSYEYIELANRLPKEPGRMAVLLTALGPIMIAYPFFQKYFVKGLTVGAVKG